MLYYIASCSFGKDSLAMVLKLIEENEPLNEVIFYDTEMEFQAIYNIRDRVKEILNEKGIVFTELKPDRPFLYDMLEKEICKRNGKIQYGYGWCGGPCRWGTTLKVHVIDKHIPKDKSEITMYVGIAIDEPERLERLDSWKFSPLAKWNMTEKDCLEYCRQKGFDWKENGVDLYDILDRVSCWCCRNKNLKELKNIYNCLPEYWNKLLYLQDRIKEPMKQSGDLHSLQERFDDENAQITIFDLGITEVADDI